MSRKNAIAGLALLLVLCGCASAPKNTVTQVSVIDALLASAYDGQTPCAELLKYGDFGIGTFDRLDGEMIVLDGRVYQAKSDGKIYSPAPSVTTPLAVVCRFEPDRTIPLSGLKLDALYRMVDAEVANPNSLFAIKISGDFRKVKFRSVPAQAKPYRPLAAVVEEQSVYEMENVSGTIVGFRCPPFVKGINVPGYHVHFISSDGTRGGHVLDLEISGGVCRIDECNRIVTILPEDAGKLGGLDLSVDRSKELEKVEK